MSTDQPKPATGCEGCGENRFIETAHSLVCKVCGLTKPKPRKEDAASPATGEWTAARLQEEIRFKGFHNVAAAINAALAAEREASENAERTLEQSLNMERETNQQLRDQLAAEREHAKQAGDANIRTNEMLTAVRHERDEAQKQIAAERAKVQTLVDALDTGIKRIKAGNVQAAQMSMEHALAKGSP